MHSIRHHPASVGTQIREFGRGATGHGSEQDAAHSGTGREVRPGACHGVQRRCCDKLDLRWLDPRVLRLQSAPR